MLQSLDAGSNLKGGGITKGPHVHVYGSDHLLLQNLNAGKNLSPRSGYGKHLAVIKLSRIIPCKHYSRPGRGL